MPPLLIAAPASLSGKTTAAVALGHRLKDAGRAVALLRLSGGDHAEDDARLFAGLAINISHRAEPVQAAAVAGADEGFTLIEAPAGDPRQAAEPLSANTVVVVAYADPLPADIPSFCEAMATPASASSSPVFPAAAWTRRAPPPKASASVF